MNRGEFLKKFVALPALPILARDEKKTDETLAHYLVDIYFHDEQGKRHERTAMMHRKKWDEERNSWVYVAGEGKIWEIKYWPNLPFGDRVYWAAPSPPTSNFAKGYKIYGPLPLSHTINEN